MFWATIAVIGRCWWGLVRDRHALLYYYGKLLRRCPTIHPFIHLSIHILSIHRIAQASLALKPSPQCWDYRCSSTPHSLYSILYLGAGGGTPGLGVLNKLSATELQSQSPLYPGDSATFNTFPTLCRALHSPVPALTPCPLMSCSSCPNLVTTVSAPTDLHV